MSRYVSRRLALILALVLVITIISYVIYALAPGDAVSAMIDREIMQYLDLDDLQELREYLGLNKPIPVRYALRLGQALPGNLGYSIWYKRSPTR